MGFSRQSPLHAITFRGQRALIEPFPWAGAEDKDRGGPCTGENVAVFGRVGYGMRAGRRRGDEVAHCQTEERVADRWFKQEQNGGALPLGMQSTMSTEVSTRAEAASVSFQ